MYENYRQNCQSRLVRDGGGVLKGVGFAGWNRGTQSHLRAWKPAGRKGRRLEVEGRLVGIEPGPGFCKWSALRVLCVPLVLLLKSTASGHFPWSSVSPARHPTSVGWGFVHDTLSVLQHPMLPCTIYGLCDFTLFGLYVTFYTWTLMLACILRARN